MDQKNEVNKLLANEESRNETLRKSIASTNTLQQNLQTEIARVNDERVENLIVGIRDGIMVCQKIKD